MNHVLGEIHSDFYNKWFDTIFLISALASLIFIYVSRRQYITKVYAGSAGILDSSFEDHLE
jgi:hypothetical protein